VRFKVTLPQFIIFRPLSIRIDTP